jgi:MYXO-CTERM domain-containing protein
MRTFVIATALGLGLALAPAVASAYCPSYTPAQTAGGQNCGVDPVPGSNPSVAQWGGVFAKVAPGKVSWGLDGPDVQKIGSGCGKPNPTTQVDARFPCHVLMSIAMVETGWRQFCVPDTPAGSVGAPERTIVSFDCGYGIGQVTSGMHVGETPSFDRKRVAAEPTYNLATGTRILAGKWAATQCVGDNNPDLVEDWYTAIWAYNGLAYSNNPNNPNLTAGRGPYNPKNGGSYAYQEKVLGWMEFPPDAAHWKSLAPAYPNRGDLGTSGAPPAIPEPSCASPTSCASTRATHVSSCGNAPITDGGAPGDSGSNVVPIGQDGGARADGGGGDGAQASGGCSCDTSSSPADGTSISGTWLLALATLVVLRGDRSRRRSKRST